MMCMTCSYGGGGGRSSLSVSKAGLIAAPDGKSNGYRGGGDPVTSRSWPGGFVTMSYEGGSSLHSLTMKEHINTVKCLTIMFAQ